MNNSSLEWAKKSETKMLNCFTSTLPLTILTLKYKGSQNIFKNRRVFDPLKVVECYNIFLSYVYLIIQNYIRGDVAQW